MAWLNSIALPDAPSHMEGPLILYVFSPSCGACQRGLPEFNREMSGLQKVFKANVHTTNVIEYLARKGVQIQYVPTVVGLSASGKAHVLPPGLKRRDVARILEALSKTK